MMSWSIRWLDDNDDVVLLDLSWPLSLLHSTTTTTTTSTTVAVGTYMLWVNKSVQLDQYQDPDN